MNNDNDKNNVVYSGYLGKVEDKYVEPRPTTIEEAQFIEDLGLFATEFITPVSDHLISETKAIYDNKVVVNMLRLYAQAREIALNAITHEMVHAMTGHFVTTSTYDPTAQVDEYFKALRVLLVDDWWESIYKVSPQRAVRLHV